MRFFIWMFLGFLGALQSDVINQSVVNLYVEPKEEASVDSQAVYGSFVEGVEQSNSWCKVKMPDGVEGWVLSSQIVANPDFEQSENLRPVKNLFAHVYRVTDTTPFPPLLTLPYGARIKLEEPVDTGERWVPIELASGEKAWIQRGDVEFEPKRKTLEEMLAFSKNFLGLPYTWGGTSSYGFDCSGFVQMLFKEMGVLLPRNSREQAASPLLTPVEREDLQPGDLIFFGEERIIHVGLYLGNQEYIHAGVREEPVVRISHLQTGKYPFYTARRLR